MNVIRIFYSPEEAMTALSLLKAHGIEARILDSQTLSVLPLDSVALGGYRLAVLDDQAEQGLALLEDHQPHPIAPENRQYFGDEYEEEQERTGTSNNKRLLLIGLIGLLFVIIFWGRQWGQTSLGIDWLF